MDKRKIIPFILSAVCITAILIVTVIAFKNVNGDVPSKNGNVIPEASGNVQASENQSISEYKSESETEVGKGEASSNSGHINTDSFYSGVKYRSPTAKPADIEKHGRNLMLLNKEYELPEDFEWNLVYWSNGKSVDALSLNHREYDRVFAVDKEAYEPLKKMFADAEKAGVPLQMVSPYRSIQKQDRLFTESVNYYMNKGYSESEAIKKANYSRTFTGTSEHNTGLGFDILQKGNWNLTQSFEETAQFKWLIENAENYGFILRYPKDKTDITEIMYEPWHFRYVGIDNAKKINGMEMCLEEYIEYLDGEK